MKYPAMIDGIDDLTLKKKLKELWVIRQVVNKAKTRKPLRTRIAKKYDNIMKDYIDAVNQYNTNLKIQKNAFDLIIESLVQVDKLRRVLERMNKEAEINKRGPVVIIDGIDVTAIAQRQEYADTMNHEIKKLIDYARKRSVALIMALPKIEKPPEIEAPKLMEIEAPKLTPEPETAKP